jgi:hypothetical protein
VIFVLSLLAELHYLSFPGVLRPGYTPIVFSRTTQSPYFPNSQRGGHHPRVASTHLSVVSSDVPPATLACGRPISKRYMISCTARVARGQIGGIYHRRSFLTSRFYARSMNSTELKTLCIRLSTKAHIGSHTNSNKNQLKIPWQSGMARGRVIVFYCDFTK